MRAKMDCLGKLFLLACAIGLVTPILAVQDEKPTKVAMLESVFAGRDRKQIIQQIQPFADIVQKETGTKATFDIYSLKEVEPAFNRGEIQLVILTGLEYGWIRAKNDQARALVQADIDAGATQTMVVTKTDGGVKDIKELAGAEVAFPERTPFLTEFYLKKVLGKPAEEFFKVTRSDTVDDLLESVIDGKAKAGVVTKSNLAVFEERKPGRYRRLQVIHESPSFPAATVMYHDKYADKKALRRFEDALLGANQKAEGQRVLTLYKLKGFQKLPSDFESKVAEMAKQFPEQ